MSNTSEHAVKRSKTMERVVAVSAAIHSEGGGGSLFAGEAGGNLEGNERWLQRVINGGSGMVITEKFDDQIPGINIRTS